MDFELERGLQNHIIWTDEQVNYVIDSYESGITSVELSNQFHCTGEAIIHVLRTHGVRGRRRDFYPVDERYFQKIDTHEKAYWLGVMYADGYVTKTDVVGLGMIDKEHIEKFKSAIGAENNKIRERDQLNRNGIRSNNKMYSLQITSHLMASDLIANGCVRNKTYYLNDLPNLPDDLMWDFVRGVIDGDGSIIFSNGYGIDLCAYSKQFLENMKEFLGVQHLKIVKRGSGHTYSFRACAMRDVKRIITKMYKHSTESSRLNRKYNKCMEALEWINDKQERRALANAS